MPHRRVSFSEQVVIRDHIHYRDMSVEEHRSSFMDGIEMRQIREEAMEIIEGLRSHSYNSRRGGSGSDDSSTDSFSSSSASGGDFVTIDDLSDEYRGFELYCNDRMDALRRKGYDVVMRAQRVVRAMSSSRRKSNGMNTNPEVIATIYRTVTKDSKVFAEKMGQKDYQAACF